MSRLRPVAFLFLLVAFVLPGQALAWGVKGLYEPDTQADITGGWMFPGADIAQCGKTAPVYCSSNQVYLNGFHDNGVAGGPQSGNSLNFATVRTDIYYAEGYSYVAALGVWKDCNNDGYMGLGDQGLLEYRAEILANWPGTGASICPVTTTPTVPATGNPPMDWFPSHNDGQWVREYIPLAWPRIDPVVGDTQPWDANDRGARVWVDFGLPGDWQTPSLNCWWPTPGGYPRGTFQSTGGFLEYWDCWGGGRITDTFDTAVEQTDATRSLSFADHPSDQHNSESDANVKNPWGHSSDASYAKVWDCGQTQPVSVTRTQDTPVDTDTPFYVAFNVSAPRVPPTADPTRPDASISGTINETSTGVDYAAKGRGLGSQGGQNPGCSRDGNTVDTTGTGTPYSLEGDVVNPHFKTAPDATLAPQYDARPAAPWSALGRATPTGDETLAGSHLTTSDGFWSESVQHEEAFFLNSRDELAAVRYDTFYAYVDPAAIAAYHLSLPKTPYDPLSSTHTPATGKYGQEACGGFTSGIHNMWDCASGNWYKDAFGKDIEPTSVRVGTPDEPLPYGSRPGALYDLRDIDCYDESVQALRTQGVSWGVVTGTACDEAP